MIRDHVEVVDKEIRNAWLQKSKLRELRTAFRMKLFGAVLLARFALGGTSYYLGLVRL